MRPDRHGKLIPTAAASSRAGPGKDAERILYIQLLRRSGHAALGRSICYRPEADSSSLSRHWRSTPSTRPREWSGHRPPVP